LRANSAGRELQIFFDFGGGGSQRKTVTWIDDNTIDFCLVEQRPFPGLVPGQPMIRYHRQTAPINPNGKDVAEKPNQGPFPPIGGPSKTDLDAAEARYSKALAEKGPKHIDTLLAHRDVAQLYIQAGRFDEAKPILLDVLDGLSDRAANDDIRRFTITLWLQCPLYMGDPPPEFSVLRKYLPELRKALSDGSPPLGDMLSVIGLCLLNQNKFAEAEPVLRECLGIREKHVPNDGRTYNARAMLGGSLLGQEKYADAEPLLTMA
jgi:hypothetical protein